VGYASLSSELRFPAAPLVIAFLEGQADSDLIWRYESGAASRSPLSVCVVGLLSFFLTGRAYRFVLPRLLLFGAPSRRS